MTAQDITIGELARRTGASAPTIRYYESIGLLGPPARRAGGHRLYGERDVRRLAFVRRCRGFDLPLDETSKLLALLDDKARPCLEARDIARAHLDEVQKRLVELRALERELKQFVSDCDARCAGGPSGACVILEDLARPPAPKRARAGKRR